MSLCHLCLGGPAEHHVPGYAIQVCQTCWRAAEAGWPQAFEATLMQALAQNGLLIPDRNPQGRLPRQYQPPANFAL